MPGLFSFFYAQFYWQDIKILLIAYAIGSKRRNKGPIICMNFILFFSIFFTHSSEEWKSHRIEIKRVWRFFLSSNWIQLLLKWEHNRFHLETFVCLLWVRVSTIDYSKHIHSFALNFQTNSNTAYYLQPRKKVHNCLLILFDCLLCCACVCLLMSP